MDVFYDLILAERMAKSQLFWRGNGASMMSKSRSKALKKMWKDTSRDSDVIRFTSFVVQCAMGRWRLPGPEPEIRRKIEFPVEDGGARIANILQGEPDTEGHVGYHHLHRD
jgi:hypothetical protein